MKTKTQSIVLEDPSERIVKRIALYTFKTGRGLIHRAKHAPNALKSATVDIKQAWHESSIPNV